MTVLGAADTLRCPIDDVDFHPYYTDGACPICGWRPSDVEVARPWWQTLDPALTAFLATVLVAVVMVIVVLVVYWTT